MTKNEGAEFHLGNPGDTSKAEGDFGDDAEQAPLESKDLALLISTAEDPTMIKKQLRDVIDRIAAASRSKTWTADQLEEMMDRHMKGESMEQIGESLNTTKGVISNKIRTILLWYEITYLKNQKP